MLYVTVTVQTDKVVERKLYTPHKAKNETDIHVYKLANILIISNYLLP